MKVYLLWLHDSILAVYRTRRGALLAAARFRRRPEYRGLTWETRDRLRWWTSSRTWKPGDFSIARLEVEERRVR